MKYTNNASFKGDALATFRSDEHNKAIITAFIWPQGTDEYICFLQEVISAIC